MNIKNDKNMEDKPKVYLAILNITSWCGYDTSAIHIYGHLTLSTKEDITIDNVTEYNIKYLGEGIELFREITFEEAQELDIRDQSYGMCQRHWRNGDKLTNRFNTFKEVEQAAIAKWKELNINCPFISLYEGEKYDFDYKGEKGKTKILQYE